MPFAHPALSDAVLLWRVNGRARLVQTCGAQEPDDIAVKHRVVVKQRDRLQATLRIQPSANQLTLARCEPQFVESVPFPWRPHDSHVRVCGIG
jgi:hypothetical protein